MRQDAALSDSATTPQDRPLAGAGLYRPDIDGLRAIAVFAVVVFHAGLRGLPGGFVGVDIFFVISGYLICGQIFREMELKKFSFAFFYSRRARRILPALYALLVVMLVAGVILMTPLELKELCKEAVATILGMSNIVFYTGGGYFAPAAELNPLLMTWSLGVEEQFYLLFPILMLLLIRFGRNPDLIVLIIASALSFAGSILLMHINAKAAFYLIPTRAWELGLGAILALWEQGRAYRTLPRWTEEAAGLVGAVLLAAALVLYRDTYAFPGFYALLPTVGAAILIATRNSAVNRRVLGQPAIAFVGKVSYSWYLWHWPLFFFDRILEPNTAPHPVVLIVLSFALGVASWWIIERPFRRRILPQGVVLVRYGLLALVLAAPALGLYFSDGWPRRFSPTMQAFSEASRKTRENPCLAPYGARSIQDGPACLPPIGAGRQGRLLVLGDSHAGAISPGMKLLATKSGLEFGEITKTSCPPLWGFARDMPERAGHLAECIAFQERAFSYVESHPEIRVVVLAGYWSSDPTTKGKSPSGGAGYVDAPLPKALDYTVSRLQALGRQVVLVQDVPMFRFDPYARVMGDLIPARAALSSLLQGRREDGFMARPADLVPDPTRPIVSSVARSHAGVELLDPSQALCSQAGCRFRGADALYYSDFQHLTFTGALEAVRGLAIPATP